MEKREGPHESLADYDYHLPDDRIAQHPPERRDASRLMVIDRASGSIRHHRFSDLPDLLESGDRLILNETKVFPARLNGRRPGTGGKIELLLIRKEGDTWEAMARPARRLKPGAKIEFPGETLKAVVDSVLPNGTRCIRFQGSGSVDDLLGRIGHIPLPPYIRREDDDSDRERYQTVYSRTPGAVAAPTAGLHFTPELFTALTAAGISSTRVLLHVGPGTFKPVEVDDIDEHEIDGEYGELSSDAAAEIAGTRTERGRLIAVGTTSVRLLETVALNNDGAPSPWSGRTSLFVRPPHQFHLVDGLITNFHLPKSTLLMLVSAFAGRDLVFEAYRTAVAEGYRFYSYGDAMLIL